MHELTHNVWSAHDANLAPAPASARADWSAAPALHRAPAADARSSDSEETRSEDEAMRGRARRAAPGGERREGDAEADPRAAGARRRTRRGNTLE